MSLGANFALLPNASPAAAARITQNEMDELIAAAGRMRMRLEQQQMEIAALECDRDKALYLLVQIQQAFNNEDPNDKSTMRFKVLSIERINDFLYEHGLDFQTNPEAVARLAIQVEDGDSFLATREA